MRRLTTMLIAVLVIAVVAALAAGSAAAKPRGVNGKIVTNSDNLVTGEEQVYTVDPDGTDEQLTYNNSEVTQWSPDGTRVVLVTQLEPSQLLLFNVDDSSSVYFGLPFDRYPGLALFCGVCFQVTTFLRPTLWREAHAPMVERGKLFFLDHFSSALK